jgi:hypothetical protein
MRFEKPSMDECKELIGRLRGKSAEEIIGIFGQPARETGARKEERLADGVPWVIEIRRTLIYFDIGPTIHRLRVIERVDGQCELQMSGREIPDEPAA